MGTPTQIGRYMVVGHLASGGMAEILLGKLIGPKGFERPVVIKRILPHLASQQSFVTMFLDEARVIARMRHPNIVQVQELGQVGQDLFLVMEYLEGESLSSIARRTRKLGAAIEPVLAAQIVAEACAGLHAAHELKDDAGQPLGLVHRDVSPHNIFVTYAGSVKILDFGIAKFSERSTDTEAGQMKGKFPYMSPEQCLGNRLDRRSDVFSLGTVLFELLTGKRLYARESSLFTMQAIVGEPVPQMSRLAPKVPAQLARICTRALAKRPEDRYATAAEMRRDLVLAMRELGANALPEEALSAWMSEMFSDRVAAKEELLRRVSSGSAITYVPEAEIDVSVELPLAYQQSRPSGTPFSVEGPVGAEGEDDAPRRWPKVVAVVAVAAAIAVGLSFALSGNDESAQEETPAPALATAPPVTETPTIVDVAPVEPAATPEEVPVETTAPETVRLSFSSTPVGATVVIDGEERGVTPLELELEAGEQPIVVAISHDGYITLQDRIVPSSDERIRVALERAPVARSASSARSSTATSMTSTSMTGTSMAAESTSPFRRFN